MKMEITSIKMMSTGKGEFVTNYGFITTDTQRLLQYNFEYNKEDAIYEDENEYFEQIRYDFENQLIEDNELTDVGEECLFDEPTQDEFEKHFRPYDADQ